MKLRILTARLALSLLAALAFVPAARAQQARVVAACGSLAPFGPNTPGTQALPTVDITGKLCLSGAGGGAGTITFPQTVGGTTNSGGIPYFSSPTVLSSSAVLAANSLVVGAGAGGAPKTTFAPIAAGDIAYWNGTAWTRFPGNTTGTQFLSESAAGVPAWANSAGGIPSFATTCPASSTTSAVTLANGIPVVAKSASYPAVAADCGTWFEVTGTTTITMPSSVTAGFFNTVHNAGSGVVTVSGGANTINANGTVATAVTLFPGQSMGIVANSAATGWDGTATSAAQTSFYVSYGYSASPIPYNPLPGNIYSEVCLAGAGGSGGSGGIVVSTVNSISGGGGGGTTQTKCQTFSEAQLVASPLFLVVGASPAGGTPPAAGTAAPGGAGSQGGNSSLGVSGCTTSTCLLISYAGGGGGGGGGGSSAGATSGGGGSAGVSGVGGNGSVGGGSAGINGGLGGGAGVVGATGTVLGFGGSGGGSPAAGGAGTNGGAAWIGATGGGAGGGITITPAAGNGGIGGQMFGSGASNYTGGAGGAINSGNPGGAGATLSFVMNGFFVAGTGAGGGDSVQNSTTIAGGAGGQGGCGAGGGGGGSVLSTNTAGPGAGGAGGAGCVLIIEHH